MADDAPTPPTEPSPVTVEAPPPSEDWATRFKYLYADFENFRRRTERERESVALRTRATLLRELLPLLEAFRAAHDSAAQLPATDPLRRGIELLDREWTKFLNQEGIEPVAAPGDPFRADEAEAVGETPPSSEAADGHIAEVVQQGYRFGGGLLRPAKVLVARAPRPAAPAEGSAPDTNQAGGESL